MGQGVETNERIQSNRSDLVFKITYFRIKKVKKQKEKEMKADEDEERKLKAEVKACQEELKIDFTPKKK